LTEKERKKIIGTPDIEVSKLLNEFNSQDAIKKMKENDISSEQFWDLS